MFQTRLFATTSVHHPDYKVNLERIRFFKSLKNRLGARLVGGIADSKIARSIAPELIVERCDIHSYIKELRDSSICVSTPGLAGTNPDKLPSYLSMSRCVVSTRLNHEIPEPLRDNFHLRFFDDVDSCADICAELLDSPDQVQQLREAGFDYFNKYASPQAVVRRCIMNAVADA